MICHVVVHSCYERRNRLTDPSLSGFIPEAEEQSKPPGLWELESSSCCIKTSIIAAGLPESFSCLRTQIRHKFLKKWIKVSDLIVRCEGTTFSKGCWF